MTERQLQSVHDDLSDVITDISDGDPVLLRHGSDPVGAPVSVADLQLLEQYWEELENRIDLDAVRDAKEEIARQGTVPWDEVKRSLRDGAEWAPHAITMTRSAWRALSRLPSNFQQGIVERIYGLAGEPRPPGATNVTGAPNT